MKTREKVVAMLRERFPYLEIEPGDIRLNKYSHQYDVVSWEATCRHKEWPENYFQIQSWSGLRATVKNGIQVLREEHLYLELA
jgi:hypothetical protein